MREDGIGGVHACEQTDLVKACNCLAEPALC